MNIGRKNLSMIETFRSIPIMVARCNEYRYWGQRFERTCYEPHSLGREAVVFIKVSATQYGVDAQVPGTGADDLQYSLQSLPSLASGRGDGTVCSCSSQEFMGQ